MVKKLKLCPGCETLRYTSRLYCPTCFDGLSVELDDPPAAVWVAALKHVQDVLLGSLFEIPVEMGWEKYQKVLGWEQARDATIQKLRDMGETAED